VTLLRGGRELPAEAFFAFFSFSLFKRTSLAEAFLCVIYIELKVQKGKMKDLHVGPEREGHRLWLDDAPDKRYLHHPI
jgi:hypothetical protein